ncbi:MAG: hypothetical protein WA691_09310 [Thermoplasmata archaeon]
MESRTAAVLVVFAGLATLPLLVGTTFSGFEFLIVPIFALTLAAGYGASRVYRELPWLIPSIIIIGLGVAVFSVFTGILNGFSDEPYSTPAYASLGWSLYSKEIAITYVQYGTVHFESSYDVYLPLLTFVQVPGLDYRWVSLTAWAGSLYFLRRNSLALAGFATPWIALLAANGQNDFVPLFAMTLALTVPLGRYGWAAEAFSLALKQWANVVVFAYHLVRREYLRAVAAAAITAAILAPFIYLDANGVWCHVIVGDPGTTCMARPWTFFVFKRNYWLYPSWVAVVFFGPLRTLLGRAVARLRPPVRT